MNSRPSTAMRFCLRCEQAIEGCLFKISEKVCDRCVAQRELERRERLGNVHPDLEGAEDVDRRDFRYVPNITAARKILYYWLVEFGVRGDGLQPQFQYDPEMLAEIRAERAAKAAA